MLPAGLADVVTDPATWLGLSLSREALTVRFAAASAWTLAALLASLLAPRLVARGSEAMRANTVQVLLIGVLAHASMALGLALTVALVRALVGLPLFALAGLAGAAVRSCGLAAGFVVAGSAVMRRGLPSAYARLLAGALVAGLLSFVPLAGPIAWMALACAGTGGVLVSWRRG